MQVVRVEETCISMGRSKTRYGHIKRDLKIFKFFHNITWYVSYTLEEVSISTDTIYTSRGCHQLFIESEYVKDQRLFKTGIERNKTLVDDCDVEIEDTQGIP